MILHGVNMHLNMHVGGNEVIPVVAPADSLLFEHQFTASGVSMNGVSPDTTDNVGTTFVTPAGPVGRAGIMNDTGGFGRPSTITGAFAVIDVSVTDAKVVWQGKNNVTNAACDHNAVLRYADSANYFFAFVSHSSPRVSIYSFTTAGGAVELAFDATHTADTAAIDCYFQVVGTQLTLVYDTEGITVDPNLTVTVANSGNAANTSIGIGDRVTALVTNSQVNFVKGYSL
jgi:hypothetical protein